MKEMSLFWLLTTMIAFTSAAPIFIEKDYLADDYFSQKYPPELIQKGEMGLISYILENSNKEALKTLIQMDEMERLCILNHPAFLLFYDEDIKAWHDEGCANFKSKKIAKIYSLWNKFVRQMPQPLREPYQKAYDYVVENDLYFSEMNNDSIRIAIEYLKATSQVLKLPDNYRSTLSKKYPTLKRFLVGDFYEPAANLIDPTINILDILLKRSNNESKWTDIFPIIINAYKSYKYGLRFLMEAKEEFLRFAVNEETYPSENDIFGFIMKEYGANMAKETHENIHKQIGSLFDLLDAYCVLCNGDHSWYQIGIHIEKWITC